MRTFLRSTVSAVVFVLAGDLVLSTALEAAPQEQAYDLPVSLERIRVKLAETPPTRLKLDMPVKVPVATFRTRVEQRSYVLSLEQWLDKEFNLTELQRQSADWAAKCCGIGLSPLFNRVEKALHRRKVRKIRSRF